MLDADQKQRLDALMARLVDETIAPDELAELETLLDGDAAAQDRYLGYLGLHADLGEGGGSGVGAGQGTARPKTRRSLALAIPAAAALLMLAFGVWRMVVGAGQDPTVAELIDHSGALRWTGDGGEVIVGLSSGHLLSGGTLETLATGSWARLAFKDGSEFTLSGRTELTISETAAGAKQLHLREGQLSAEVKPQPDGLALILQTPSAEARVLGTQFNVSADAFTTRLAVNEGLVRVKQLADGRSVDVPADHEVVAALEAAAEFAAAPRRQHTGSWRADIAGDATYGSVEGAGEQGGGEPILLAKPLLWKENPERPLLLHAAVLHAASCSGQRPPVRLGEDTRLRIRGLLDRSHLVVFGLTTLQPGGGYAGKYSVGREIEVGTDGRFELELPLSAFRPEKTFFPSSPVGHELADWWGLTLHVDAGLAITSVELFPAAGKETP